MRRVIAAALLLLTMFVGMPPTPVAAAEYRLETRAIYDVLPDDRVIRVTVPATMTNTTPDPAGRFSVFSEVKLAIHDDAGEVTANDEEGTLQVAVREEGGVNVATVQLREDLRFEQSVAIVLRYRLSDTETGQLRVRPSVVVFPAWGFGTASDVTVRIPDRYEVSLDGNELTAEVADGMTMLTSGPIDAPASWVALVTGTAPSDTVTRTASVPLNGGTVDLQVDAFADDVAWADRTVALMERALPMIEERLGLPYSEVGPLVLAESVAGAEAAAADGGSQIRLAYDAPPYTALHRVVQAWLPSELVTDRWIREGIASHVAAIVGAELDITPPYDPAAQAEARADAAFRLAEWPSTEAPEAAAYGEAASWMLVDEIEQQVGGEIVPLVLGRAAAGIGPYDRTEATPAEPSAEAPQPLDSRSILDQLEAVGDVSLGERFATLVLTAEDAALLPARAEAVASLRSVGSAAGDWGVPDPVRAAMVAWDFDAALAGAEAARDWLARRDDLLRRISELGLAAPTRLQQAYRTDGGGSESDTELEAERGVVEAYAAGLEAANAPRSLVARIGLVGGSGPEAHLAAANNFFAAGDLAAAVEEIGEAERLLADAEMSGTLRLASLAVALVIAIGAVVVLLRRRRSAAPA